MIGRIDKEGSTSIGYFGVFPISHRAYGFPAWNKLPIPKELKDHLLAGVRPRSPLPPGGELARQLQKAAERANASPFIDPNLCQIEGE